MFQPRLAIVLVALSFFCIRLSAQNLQPNGPMTLATTTESQSDSGEPASPQKEEPKKLKHFQIRPFSTFAVGIKADTLGAGIELATPVSPTVNLRTTVNLVNVTYNFNIDGINYSTQIDFRSGIVNVDWFPFHGGFHISPGLLYFQNSLSGKASVPAGQPFQLSSTSYINSVDDPVYGTVAVTYARRIAPMLTFGFGNIIPRTGKRFTVPFEIGAAYLGPAQMNIQLAGTSCTNLGCFNAATDPGTQSSLLQEEQSLNSDLAKFKFYPIISTGFAFRF